MPTTIQFRNNLNGKIFVNVTVKNVILALVFPYPWWYKFQHIQCEPKDESLASHSMHGSNIIFYLRAHLEKTRLHV
jgi:hypothetical protein